MTNNDPKVTRAEAQQLVEKLQAFRETLSPGEKIALDSVLQVWEARISDPSVRELLAEIPDGAALLEDVAGFDYTPEDPGFFTITLTTLTTTVASHPIITCS